MNIYSRKFNSFNWFNIYANQESSEKQVENKHSAIAECSKSNDYFELSDFIKFSNEIDDSKINPDLKNISGHLNQSKLYENINSNIPKFQKINLDEINFVPIWYINGSPQTNAKYCELFTTFEILIHILSKRFITFKSKLLTLSSTEIQNSVARGIKLEDYSQMKKNSLKELLLKKDDKIDELNRKIDSMMLEIRDQSLKIDNQSKLITSQNGKISSLESKVVDGLEVIKELAENSRNISKIALESNQKHKEFLEKEVPPSAVGMKQTDEIVLFIFSPRLHKEVIETVDDLKLLPGDLILDTICCQTKDLKTHLVKHKYEDLANGIPIENKGITYRLTCNSLDLNKFVQRYSTTCRVLDAKGKYFRKFVVNKSSINIFIKEFNDYVDQIEEKYRRILASASDTSSKISSADTNVNEIINNYIEDSFYDKNEISNNIILAQINHLSRTVQEIKNNQEVQIQQNEEIKNNQEKIINNQEILIELLRKLDPRVKQFQIKLDHYYYDVIIDPDNKQVTYATRRSKDGKFSDFQPLTVEIFNNSIFRDKEHTKDIYIPSKRKIIE